MINKISDHDGERMICIFKISGNSFECYSNYFLGKVEVDVKYLVGCWVSRSSQADVRARVNLGVCFSGWLVGIHNTQY